MLVTFGEGVRRGMKTNGEKKREESGKASKPVGKHKLQIITDENLQTGKLNGLNSLCRH